MERFMKIVESLNPSQVFEAVLNKQSRVNESIEGVLRNFAKFTGKHLCQGLFSNKVTGLNFAKFLRTPFLTEHLWRLLLNL